MRITGSWARSGVLRGSGCLANLQLKARRLLFASVEAMPGQSESELESGCGAAVRFPLIFRTLVLQVGQTATT
jgi:hypothetical protein